MDWNGNTVRLLNEVAKNAEMGKHTAQDLASITKDVPMRTALERQVQDYEDLQNRACWPWAARSPRPRAPWPKWARKWA